MDKVMIIDDEIWVTEVIRNIIDWKKFGFEIVSVCHDGEEAMSVIREIQPELLLTDIRMPGKTGLEIIQEVAEDFREILCVVISGYNDFEYARTALSCGAIGYLLKPIDQKELERVVEKARGILEQSAAQRGAELRMQEKYEQTMDTLREQFFSGLLEGQMNQHISCRDVNQRLKMKFKDGYYRLIWMLPSPKADLRRLFADVNKTIWKHQLPVLCSEILPFIWRRKILLLLNYERERRSEIGTRVAKMAQGFPAGVSGLIFLEGEEFSDLGKMTEESRRMKPLEFIRLRERAGNFYSSAYLKAYGEAPGNLLPPNLDISIRQAVRSRNAAEAEKTVADAYGHMSMRSGDHPASYGEGILKMVDILKKSAQGCPDGIRMIVAEMTEDIEAAESQEEIKEIFCRTARRLTEENSDMDEKREKTAVEWIRDYIDRHYSGSISLTDMSEMVHLNANYFSDIFHRETGKSFNEYLPSVRMEAAKTLLRQTGYKQGEVAAMAGYRDVKHFTRVFKKYVGISPSEYRKLMRE